MCLCVRESSSHSHVDFCVCTYKATAWEQCCNRVHVSCMKKSINQYSNFFLKVLPKTLQKFKKEPQQG